MTIYKNKQKNLKFRTSILDNKYKKQIKILYNHKLAYYKLIRYNYLKSIDNRTREKFSVKLSRIIIRRY